MLLVIAVAVCASVCAVELCIKLRWVRLIVILLLMLAGVTAATHGGVRAGEALTRTYDVRVMASILDAVAAVGRVEGGGAAMDRLGLARNALPRAFEDPKVLAEITSPPRSEEGDY